MRRFLSLLLPLSLGLVLVATSCDPKEPDGGSGDDAGSEEPLPDAGGDAGHDTDAGMDAGTDAGGDPGTPDAGGDPGTPDAGTEPGEACTASDPQPSSCDYGSFCGSGGTCQSVPTPDCRNFTNYPHPWDPATASGPVIHAAEVVSYAMDEVNCPFTLPMRIRTRIRAYSPSGGLPTDAAGLAAVFTYVREDGSTFADASRYSDVSTSADLKNTEFLVNLCTRAEQTSVSLGFFFEGGNGYCRLATR